MRHFRFSILQLLLASTLVALVLGLVTSAWRATQYQSIEHVCFSPSGTLLAARYSGGGVGVWRVDQGGFRPIAKVPGKFGFLSFSFGSIHFVADDLLLIADTPMGSAGAGVNVRRLNPQTRQFGDAVHVNALTPWMGVQAATADRLLIADWSSNSVASYRLDTGGLEQRWPLPSPPLGFIAMSANGKTMAVCDQGGQVSVVDVKSDQTPVRIQGYWPVVLSADGRLVATASPNKPGLVHVYDLTAPDPPVKVKFDLSMLRAMAILPNGQRLMATDGAKVEYYDLARREHLPAIEMDDSRQIFAALCAFSPAGDRLAVYRGSEIVTCDLASGKARRTAGGGPQVVPIAIYTLAFAVWSVVWGIVAKRERRKQPRDMTTALPRALQPASRPVPMVIPAKITLAWMAGTIALVLIFFFIMEGASGRSLLGGVFEMFSMTVSAVLPALAVVCVVATLTYLVKGPHFLTLGRLRQLTRDVGRVQRVGRLTFWFAGRSRAAGNITRQLDAVLDNAETLFGQPVEFKRRRLIACLDRQCDQDAYFRRHVPLAASIPFSWIDRVGLVSEETATMQLLLPEQALRSVLAFSILSEQKRGFLASWVAALLTLQITRDQRRPAEVRAAIRRLKMLLTRQPQWDPRQVFFRSHRERFGLLLAIEERPAWLEVRAESDVILTLSEMLLGLDAPAELRQRTLAWLRGITSKDDALATFTRDVGLTLDALLETWRQWLAAHSGQPYDPLPTECRWLLRDVAVPTLADDELPIAVRQRMVRQLGTFSVAGASLLMEMLSHPKIELRREAALSLELLSGETCGDDLARWQTWWQALDPVIRGDQDPLGRMVTAAAVDEPRQPAVLEPAPRVSAPAAPAELPRELKICWGLMLVSGFNALLIPIALIFFIGPVMHPLIYFSLFVGVAAIVTAVTRETRRMAAVAKLQMMNAMACDPINLFAGMIEQMLLKRPNVQRYLTEVNAGRA